MSAFPRLAHLFLACAAILLGAAPLWADPFSYGPISDVITSATFGVNFAAFTGNRTVFGFEVNHAELLYPGFPALDLSDVFFGTSDFPDTPQINMGPLETGIVSVPIPSSFFPALSSGSVGYDLLFTDTGDGLFAIDYVALTISTASTTITSFLGPHDEFGLGIPPGGMLPAPLPDSLPFDSTGTGFDETITSKNLEATVVPEPSSIFLLGGAVGLVLLRRKNSRHVMMLLMALLAFPTVSQGAAKSCPPVPADKAGAAKPVPGKPGETGWPIDTTFNEVDDQGNTIQEWCLEKNAKHDGPDFALLWKAKGAKDEDAVWIGACVFPHGGNQPNKDFVDADHNGKPDKFNLVTWINFEPPPVGTNGWKYEYDPTTGKLKVKKLKGSYDPGTENFRRDDTKTETDDPYDAPKDFEGLKFKGKSIVAASPGPDGSVADAFTAVANVSGGVWHYSLLVSSRTGIAGDAFGELSELQLGDQFTISGIGISNPQVLGNAGLPAFGGWVVKESGASFVTFQATSAATFAPGDVLDGFGFFSTAPVGNVFWDVASSNEEIGSSGIVTGPAPRPDQLHILGPIPNQIGLGQSTSITASVQTGGKGVPVASVSFSAVAGKVLFIDGTPTPSGNASTASTDGNGNTTMRFTVQSPGLILIKVALEGTTLSTYSILNVR